MNNGEEKLTLFLPAWTDILPIMEEGNQSRLSRKVNVTYSYFGGIVKELESLNLVIKTKKGRASSFKLTKQGQRIKDALDVLKGHIRIAEKIYD